MSAEAGEAWRGTVRLLWVVQFVTTLAMNLGLTFLPFVLRDDPVLAIADDATRLFYVSLILGAPFLSTILFTPLWGWVADRAGPRPQVIRACIGLGATQLLMALAQSADQMVAIRVLQGMVAGVLSACLGLATTVVPESHQGRAVAWIHSATPAGQILGPLLGGLLAVAIGFRATYLLLGAGIVLMGVVAAWWLPVRPHTPRVSANPLRGLAQAFGQAARQAEVARQLLVLMAAQFAFTLTQGVWALFAARIWNAAWPSERSSLRPDDWGLTDVGFVSLTLALLAGANALCGPRWGAWQDRGARHLQLLGALTLAGALAWAVLWPTWWGLLLSRLLTGMALASLATLPFSAIARHTPPEARGQMTGLTFAVSQVGNLAGFVSGGILAAQWGEPGNLLLSVAVYALIAVVLSIWHATGVPNKA